MSVLPAGQSLTRFLPDLEDLVHDPRAYLTQEPVTIGPRQMYGLTFLFGFVGGAFLLSCVLTGQRDGERLALGIGLLCGASIWLGWSLMMRGHSLVLHPDGVEVKYRGTTVWCPWCVFNVDGHAFVPDADSPRVGLTLPIAPESVPFIELRREDTPIAHGAQVRARQWQFIASDTVVLPARYEVMAGELGALILELGRRLGRQTPKGLPPPEAYDTRDLDSVPAVPAAGGWITVHLTRLVFPPQCCDCGERTHQTMNFTVESRWDIVTGVLVPASSPLQVPIPMCETCQQRIRDRQHHGGMRGMQVGAFLACGLTILLALSQGWRDASLLFVFGIAALALGGLTGFILGTLSSKRLPAELSRYSPGRGTVALRFDRPGYAAGVLAAMRAGTPQGEPNERGSV
jgi:hypothetical protein